MCRICRVERRWSRVRMMFRASVRGLHRRASVGRLSTNIEAHARGEQAPDLASVLDEVLARETSCCALDPRPGSRADVLISTRSRPVAGRVSPANPATARRCRLVGLPFAAASNHACGFPHTALRHRSLAGIRVSVPDSSGEAVDPAEPGERRPIVKAVAPVNARAPVLAAGQDRELERDIAVDLVELLCAIAIAEVPAPPAKDGVQIGDPLLDCLPHEPADRPLADLGSKSSTPGSGDSTSARPHTLRSPPDPDGTYDPQH